MRKLPQPEWTNVKREKLQTYRDYSNVLNNAIKFIPLLTTSINSPETNLGRKMLAAHSRGEQSLNLIIYSYSAGAPVNEIAEEFPECLQQWKNFAEHNLRFEESTENDGHKVPHFDLYNAQYWHALLMICFAILLGHSNKLSEIMELLIHENDDQDALLEDLVAPYLLGRPISTIYTRQLPYRKTRKIFEANPEERPALMAQYLKEWYLASRREPYYDRHKSALFPGYWSLEAGAITFILGIDDSGYHNMPFYPKDLVDYARSVSSPPGHQQPNSSSILRRAAGELCPQSGWWLTPAQLNSRRYIQQGVAFPAIEDSDYGTTFWQWSADQSAPML